MKQPIEINGLFEDLPQDVNNEIKNHLLPLDETTQSALVCTSFYHYQLFQPTRLISKLLWFVATGNQDAAEKGIKLNPELLLQRGTVTDYSGRTFTNITAFEYALWALDTRYMCNMMLDCLSELGDETRGEMIKQGLFRQYKAFENNNGVQYTTRDGQEHKEKHFDFLPLLKALRVYANNFDNWNNRTRRENHWCTVVGHCSMWTSCACTAALL